MTQLYSNVPLFFLILHVLCDLFPSFDLDPQQPKHLQSDLQLLYVLQTLNLAPDLDLWSKCRG